MKKKLVIAVLIAVLTVVCAFALASCSNEDNGEKWGDVYTLQAAYGQAKKLGYGGSLEEFLESIQGKDGKDGVGIASLEINVSGELVITLTGNRQINLGPVKGLDGKDGVSVKGAAINENNELIFTLSDGSTINAGKLPAGAPDKDGKGISNAHINADGELVITYTDNTSENLGKIVGADGKDGVSITGATINSNGALELTFSNNKTLTVGNVVDKDGGNGVGISSLEINSDGELVVTLTDDTVTNLGKLPTVGCEHNYAEQIVAATCTDLGYTKHTCALCGHEYFSNLTNRVTHDFVEVYELSSSCLSRKVLKECKTCGELQFFTEQTTEEHTFGEWTIAKEATCTENGLQQRVCLTDGVYTETKIIPAKGHNFVVSENKPSTCTEDGYIKYICDACGASKTEVLISHGHNFGYDNVCDVCGFAYEIHEHNYAVTTVEPTCSQMGYTLYTCECGNSYKNDYIESLGHRWNEGVESPLHTCTKDGVITYSCVRSGCDVSYTQPVKAHHSWSESVTKPVTCTVDGSVIKNCTVCGASETKVIPASHTWIRDVVVKEATCTEGGQTQYVCGVCSETKIEEYKPLGHKFVDGVCTRCGVEYIDIVVDNPSSLVYGMYFKVDDVQSNYGPAIINEYGVLLEVNKGAILNKVAVYLTQDGTMWRRAIACTGSNITYATYVPYLSYNEDIYYTGQNSQWINTFELSEGADGIWRYNDYVTIGANLEDSHGNLLLSLCNIGQAGAKTKIFDNLDEMKAWLLGDHEHNEVIDKEIPATCLQNGLSAGSHCSICGTVIVERHVIPATGHNFVNGVCTVCNENEPLSNEAFLASLEIEGVEINPAFTEGVTEYTATVPNSVDVVTVFAVAKSPATIVSGTGNHAICLGSNVISVVVAAEDGTTERTYKITIMREDAPVLSSEAFLANIQIVGVTLNPAFSAEVTSYVATVPNSVEHVTVIAIAKAPATAPVITGNNALQVGANIIQIKVVAEDGVTERTYTITIMREAMLATPDEYFTFALLSDDTYEVKAKDVNNLPAEVVIPSSYNGKPVTSIGVAAFMRCSYLVSITIPNSITSIGNQAIAFCDSLTNITISSSVTSIGYGAFSGCDRLESIFVAEGNSKYHSAGNCLIETATKTLVLGCKNSVIPTDGSVTRIGDVAFFAYKSLTSITIPDSVTSIGNQAFADCCLTSITIPDSVTSIGYDAFSGCSSSLESIIVSEGNTKYHSNQNCLIETENKRLICGCKNSVIPSDGSVTSIGHCAFSWCRSLASITIPESVTSIGDNAFSNCSSLTNITIPNSVTSIGNYAFINCNSLTTMYYKGTAEEWAKITINIGSDNFKLISATRYYYSEIEPALNSDGTAYDDNYWHYVGNKVVVWEVKTPTEGLEYELSSDGQSYIVTGIGTSTATDIVIPSTYNGKPVTSIGSEAFRNCANLTSITIPDSVTSMGASAFRDCNSLPSITIPNSVTSIGYCAFSSCSSLTNITIPDSVTSIYMDAFRGCSSLTSVTIGNGLTIIDECLFGDCSSLTNISIGNSVTDIYSGAFLNCSGLTSIVIPDNVTIIGSLVFQGCINLTNVAIGNNITNIGYQAFDGCTSLTSITIPDSVTSIGEAVFSGCDSLESIVVSDGNPKYHSTENCLIETESKILLYGCKNSVIPTDGSVTSIGDHALYGCSSLVNITIPNSVTSIGSWAFADCNDLTSVTIGNEVTSIGEYAFYTCSSLTYITISNSVTSIGEQAFYACNSLTTVYYKGNAAEWTNITISNSYNDNLISATRYYYSETEPALNSDGTAYDGNYWHYDTDGVTPVVWAKEN